jgi:1,4-alpha-glucan branching enzyme
MGSSWNDCHGSEGDRLYRRDPCAREADFDSKWCILHPPVQPPKPWSAPKFCELVIYELHVGTFVTEDKEREAFKEVTTKLEYIADLGFNCLQLMPTAEFGGIWGYNSRQLLASHGPWGSAAEMRALVDRAHELGLAVLFDVVLNHGAAKRNELWMYDGFGPNNNGGIYFEGGKSTPWGMQFSWHKAEVQDYLKQACRTWIEEYGVDGLRFDSVHNMPWWLLQQLTHGIKEHYPEKILIAEITPENPAVNNDAGFHSCWLHATHFDAMKLMKKKDGGENPRSCIKMLKNMVIPHGFGHIGGVHSALGSHDQIGDRHGGNQDGHGTHRYFVSRFGGRDNWHARAQTRAWFAFQNCCCGLPMTFMGTETLQNDWWHVDQHRRFNWHLAEGDDQVAADMRRLVSASNKLRISSAALHGNEVRFLQEDQDNVVLSFMRWSGEEACLVVAHFGEGQWENRDYGVNTGWGGGRRWKLTLNTQDGSFGGWEGSAADEVEADGDGKIMISIPKWSCLIYRAF